MSGCGDGARDVRMTAADRVGEIDVERVRRLAQAAASTIFGGRELATGVRALCDELERTRDRLADAERRAAKLRAERDSLQVENSELFDAAAEGIAYVCDRAALVVPAQPSETDR